MRQHDVSAETRFGGLRKATVLVMCTFRVSLEVVADEGIRSWRNRRVSGSGE